MPHDVNGKLVEKGATVKVDFVVTDVDQGDDYCNCQLETVLPMFPGDHKTGLIVNTKQVEVVESPPV